MLEFYKKNKYNKINIVLAFITWFINIVFLIIGIISKNNESNFYVSIILAFIFPLIIPMIEIVFKKRIPYLLEIVVCIQTILALSISQTFNMYEKWKNWDMLLHGMMGLEGTIIGYFICIIYGGKDWNFFKKAVFIIAFVLAFACLWEIMEYTCDNIFNTDFQKVFDPNEKSGVSDTMNDIIIALIVCLVSVFICFIDNIIKKRLINYLNKTLDIKELNGEDNNV